MSRNRQWRPVTAIAEDFPHATELPEHHHNRAQVIHGVSGVMRVTTSQGIWIVPPGRGLWVPPRVTHAIRMRGRVLMRTAYIHPTEMKRAPEDCSVLRVSPLLRELLVRLCELPQPYPLGGAEERIARLVLDELHAAPVAPLHLPTPRDPRLRRVADALLADPADGRSLADWGKKTGASDRTLARGFVRETGMTLGAWRQQARLLQALEMLGEGRPVTTVALDLGYDSPSAFIAMFRRALGTTPARYFREFRFGETSGTEEP